MLAPKGYFRLRILFPDPVFIKVFYFLFFQWGEGFKTSPAYVLDCLTGKINYRSGDFGLPIPEWELRGQR